MIKRSNALVSWLNDKNGLMEKKMVWWTKRARRARPPSFLAGFKHWDTLPEDLRDLESSNRTIPEPTHKKGQAVKSETPQYNLSSAQNVIKARLNKEMRTSGSKSRQMLARAGVRWPQRVSIRSHTSKTGKQGMKEKAADHRPSWGTTSAEEEQTGRLRTRCCFFPLPGMVLGAGTTNGRISHSANSIPGAGGKPGGPGSRCGCNRERSKRSAGPAHAGPWWPWQQSGVVESTQHQLWEKQQDHTSPKVLGAPNRRRVWNEQGWPDGGRLLRSQEQGDGAKETQAHSTFQSAPKADAESRPSWAEVTAHTSEGIAVFLSWSVLLIHRQTNLPQNTSEYWLLLVKTAQNRHRFRKGKIWIPIQVVSLTSHVTSGKSKIPTSSSTVTNQWGTHLPDFKGKR